MKRLFLISCFMLAAVCSLLAGPVSEADARRVANKFFAQKSARFTAPSVSSPARLAYTAELGRFYVFDRGAQGGFVVVAGDDRIPQVLGYGAKGDFSAPSLPPAVQYWMDEMSRQIAYLQAHPGVATAHKPAPHVAIVGPLLTSQWDQGAPYNNYCPEYTLPSGGTSRAVTGCVATAMAQVMNYHQWPPVGNGSHSYYCNVNGSTGVELFADFSQSTYRWDLMLDRYDAASSEENCDAVAQLMSDLGISVDMGYGSSSGASEEVALASLKRYFDYNDKSYLMNRDFYSADEWDKILVDELLAHRPILYCGYSHDGGHAFVIDGFDADGYYSLNWGWGGNYDGYFLVSALNPGSSDFKFGQDGMFGLVPSHDADKVEDVLYARSRLTPMTASAPLGHGITINIEDFVAQGNMTTRSSTVGDEMEYYYDMPMSLCVIDSSGVERQSTKSTHAQPMCGGWSTSGWSMSMALRSSLEDGEYKIKLFYSLDGGVTYDQEVRHHSGKELYVKMTVRNDTAYLSDCFLSDFYTVNALVLPSGSIHINQPFTVDAELNYRTWWSSRPGPVGNVYLALLNDDNQEVVTSELCEVQLDGNTSNTYQMHLTAPAEWGLYKLVLNDEGGLHMARTVNGWSMETFDAIESFFVLPVCDELVEDFETMTANNSTTDRNVQGQFTTWSFNKSGVRAPGEDLCFGNNAVMMKKPSTIQTTQPLNHNFFLAQATFFNPTSTLSKYKMEYSLDGGASWQLTNTIDGLDAVEVDEKSQVLGTWSLHVTAAQPALFRIAMIAGGSGATYVDNIALYYTDLNGDVNGDGEVNIADVNAIIDVIQNDIDNDAADVNGDGEVNIADVNVVIDIILNN